MKLNKKILFIIIICLITFSITILYLLPLLEKPKKPESESFNKIELSNSISNAINFLENSKEPYTLLWLDVIYRRFGIEEFSDAFERYDDLLNDNPKQASLLRLFRRIGDYDNPFSNQDFNSVLVDLDQITILALYCDRITLSKDYFEMLDQAGTKGDYLLTHVLLALIWIQENDCSLELPQGFEERIFHNTAALINNDSIVEDLELESAAFLYLARQGSLVDNNFINLVISDQNSDGSWGLPEYKEHSTNLGLQLLLHLKYPSDNYPPTLASE